MHTPARALAPWTSSRLTWWVLLCLGCYATYVAWATLSSRAFYADGSYFFVHIVSTPDVFNYFDDSKHIRLFVNLINQLPLILLTKLGSFEPATLRVAFNAPLFLGNALLLAGMWFYARRHQSYLVWCYAAVSFIATVLPSDIFSLNQARLAQTLYWGIIFFATAPKALRMDEKLVLGFLILASFRSHEAIIVFGPMITFAAVIGWQKVTTDRPIRVMVALAGISLTLFGLYWQSKHPVAGATSGFLQSYSGWSSQLLYRSNLFFSWSLIVLLAVSLAWTRYLPDRHPTLRRAVLCGYPALCVLVGLLPWLSPKMVQPGLEFSFRLLIPFAGAALAALALLDHLLGTHARTRWHAPTVTALMSSALLGHSLWQLSSTAQWATFSDLTRHALSVSQQPVISSEAVRAHALDKRSKSSMKYEWGWTWPAFSIALSDERTIHTVIAPDHHLDEFHASAKQPSVLNIPFSAIPSSYWDITPVTRLCQSKPPSKLLPCDD